MNDITPIRQLSSATQPVSPAKFAHFVLRTGQFEKMAEWYHTVLAARVVFRDERLCFLSYDDEHHRLALIHIPGLSVRDPEAAATDHVAYSYNNLGDLLSTSPAESGRHLAALADQPRRHDVDVLPGSRQQPGRIADRQFRDAGRARRLFPQPRLRREPSRRHL
jgi:catechol 2,3-dioxygenase-like lactoylglutathione lyase family enzyme